LGGQPSFPWKNNFYRGSFSNRTVQENPADLGPEFGPWDYFSLMLIGLFAFSQLLNNAKDRERAKQSLMSGTGEAVNVEHIQRIKIICSRWTNLLRSSFVGTLVGILPVAGGSISEIPAYD
jgi:TctA family transporter